MIVAQRQPGKLHLHNDKRPGGQVHSDNAGDTEFVLQHIYGGNILLDEWVHMSVHLTFQ